MRGGARLLSAIKRVSRPDSIFSEPHAGEPQRGGD